jgi:hypothetical protein
LLSVLVVLLTEMPQQEMARVQIHLLLHLLQQLVVDLDGQIMVVQVVLVALVVEVTLEDQVKTVLQAGHQLLVKAMLVVLEHRARHLILHSAVAVVAVQRKLAQTAVKVKEVTVVMEPLLIHHGALQHQLVRTQVELIIMLAVVAVVLEATVVAMQQLLALAV